MQCLLNNFLLLKASDEKCTKLVNIIYDIMDRNKQG